MQATNLKAVTAAGIQRCRDAQRQVDVVEVAYAACLLEEQQAWPSTTTTLCSSSNTKLPEPALTAMAERLAQELVAPADPAAAATAHLQVSLERSFKQQQDKVEAEQAQHASTVGRLAAAVAYKKVNMQAAGLPLYQSVFDQVVGYVATVAGLSDCAAADPSDATRVQVAAAVEGVLPLSSLAYFLTLPAQERMQQLESVAAVSCGICLFSSHTGSAPSPLALSADTQILQAQRLLGDVRAAAQQAEAALDHYNSSRQQQGQEQAASTDSRLAAAAAAYLCLGAGSSGSGGGGSGSSGSSDVLRLGPALFCCQAAVSLRTLAADLAAGISCCRQLHDEVLAALTQASQVAGDTPGCAVLKELVFPLFEAAGRMHLALKGELRLLLVRARLWEAACNALSTAAQQTGVPKVLGFAARRRLGSSSGGTSSGLNNTPQVFDISCLPADMQYLPPASAAAGEAEEAPTGSICWAQEEPGCAGPAEAAAAGEQQVLALSGMCPVSVASSVAAAAVAPGGDSDGVEGGAALLEGAAASPPEGPVAGQAERLLVGQMARPECGTIRYGGQLYGFSSLAALAAFAAGPESVLDAVRQAAHNAPLLLHTLGLSSSAGDSSSSSGRGDYYNSASGRQAPQQGASASASGWAGGNAGYTNSGSGGRSGSGGGGPVFKWRMPPLRGLLELFEAPLRVEAGTQTVTHPVERLVDISYQWNEWALRRRIIALANLRLKATHSAQTLSSAFRAEGSSQTWLPKEAAVQTKVNRGSSVPRKLRHVTGLRGTPGVRMSVVMQELDVHGAGASVVSTTTKRKPAPGQLK